MREAFWVGPMWVFGLLFSLWYVTVPLVLLASWGIVKSRQREPELSLRPLAGLLAWPAVALLFGMIFIDFDEDPAVEAWFGYVSNVVLLGLLFGGLAHLARIARRHPRLAWTTNRAAPLFVWVLLAATVGTLIALSGFGRHWN